ncbi:phage late control D family protein [Ruegeria sp. 6PALISEP08]|uniref:phage late control D family protein n=1 Tax=Ruegeria sp. 6PALISEP08 TaxID=1225660 RepID=UPI00067F050F|nr:phage late control D family protein [Ruegeria sp. 6PALISEP08]
MEIDFRILADGTDVTASFQDRLISMTITDKAGSKSDTAEFRVDNHDFQLALPPTGAALEMAMGFTGNLVSMGRFVVDDRSGDFDPATLTIDAKATDMLGEVRARCDWKFFVATTKDALTQRGPFA